MMFDIGWSELLIIAVVALLIIGPKELPEVMRSAGRALNKMRRSADDFRRHFEESVKDAGYDDLQQNLREFRQLNPAGQLREEIDHALNSEERPGQTGSAPVQPGVAGGADLVAAGGTQESDAAAGSSEAGKADHPAGALPVAHGETPASSGSAGIFRMTPPETSAAAPIVDEGQPQPNGHAATAGAGNAGGKQTAPAKAS